MKATRRLAKKSSIVKYTKGSSSDMTSLAIQGVIIVILIVYSAILVRYVSTDFLNFFEHIAVKIVALVIIAFVGLYSPAIALFIAIALISTLQMAQRKKLTDDIRGVKPKEDIIKRMKVMKSRLMDDMGLNVFESMENAPSQPGYLDPEMMNKKDGQNAQNDLSDYEGSGSVGYGSQDFTQAQELDYAGTPSIGTPSDTYLPMKQKSAGADAPKGFNENASCLSCSNGGDSKPALDSQCGNVKTWNNQFSAQGLGMDITGFQSTVGYPV